MQADHLLGRDEHQRVTPRNGVVLRLHVRRTADHACRYPVVAEGQHLGRTHRCKNIPTVQKMRNTKGETKLSSVLGLVAFLPKVRGEELPLNRSMHAAAFVQKSAAKNAVPGSTYI